ncbi:MAG: serine racemase VanT catalytic subunit [Oscillospiraceae bacterium]|nr:serine racemase VanT catalytic subunit [Oscillospiraceae bacterium]
MTGKRDYSGLDSFRLIAAFLVIAIHTSPLSSIDMNADFFLTRILARLAVPFFLMITGQFVLSEYVLCEYKSMYGIWKQLKKLAVLYGISILVYLPLGIYAGHYKDIGISDLLRMLLFDGTFYHLWYFPACILGILLVCLLCRFLSVRATFAVSGVLYLIGLFGDSYYGLISGVSGIKSAYDFGFQIFTYTRNGLFLAPVFLLLGAYFGRNKRTIKPGYSVIGFTVSFVIMTAEAFVLHHFQMQRHDSMYIALLPCMFFLYQLLLSWKTKKIKSLRSLSMLMYIIHPAMIVAIRGAAKAIHMTQLFVTNSLVYYSLVCVSSFVMAFGLICCARHIRKSFDPRARAWIELNQEALRYNVSMLRSFLPQNCRLMPVVKAEAYGHGAVLIARELNRMDVDCFCVASAAEGAELRKNGIFGEILVLGYTHPSQFRLLRRYNLSQTVVDFAYAEKLNCYGKMFHVHIGIDTGMRRLGERSENIENICAIFHMKHLKVDGLFTHLCADDTDAPEDIAFTKAQASAFYKVVDQLKAEGYCPRLHLTASYGLLNYPELLEDYARVGIALYGVFSLKTDTDNSRIPLWPVLSLKTRIASVREMHCGESVGYGRDFIAEHEMKIATLAIGYADGYPRILSNGAGEVLINGCRAPIVGRICMDQLMVDITGIPRVKTGDIAVLIGKSGNESISVGDIAEKAGTITNEILSRMGTRLERIIT